ncbi:hypothetical protein Pla52n_55150 [Stieleria varia]|uniref:Uncharacterized protein n=1 Tax=Stieleria varia TaxID=2528005 RepID=A0A5C6A5N2_9BACT|nr:hypothetical protein Pla52n_55150 [Stieleria varia]
MLVQKTSRPARQTLREFHFNAILVRCRFPGVLANDSAGVALKFKNAT